MQQNDHNLSNNCILKNKVAGGFKKKTTTLIYFYIVAEATHKLSNLWLFGVCKEVKGRL